jgi:hypothetical protein
MGSTHFQMKTLKNTEMALHVLAYNMKRVQRAGHRSVE